MQHKMRWWHFLTSDDKLYSFVLLLLLLGNGICIYLSHKTIGQQDAQSRVCIYVCVCVFAHANLRLTLNFVVVNFFVVLVCYMRAGSALLLSMRKSKFLYEGMYIHTYVWYLCKYSCASASQGQSNLCLIKSDTKQAQAKSKRGNNNKKKCRIIPTIVSLNLFRRV